MVDGNPLVAERQDSTTAYSGIGIVESAVDLHNGIANGSWVEGGLGLVGGGLETLSLVIDPVGTLVSYGVAWLMEHVKPLSDALDWLAGDGDTIASYAQTWRNVSQAIGTARTDFDTAVRTDTAAWTGAAGDAYRTQAAGQSEQLGAAATSADTVGTVVEVVGVLVGVVREVVRDLIADCVATLIARIPQWLAEIAGTLGIATPHVVASAVALISKWVARISDVITKLVRSVNNLRPLLRNLDEVWEAIRSGLRGLLPGGPSSPSTPGSTTTPNSPAAPDPSTVDTPTVTADGPPPTSSGTTSTPPTVSDTPTVTGNGDVPAGTTPQSATPPVSTVDAPSGTTAPTSPQSAPTTTDTTTPPPTTDGPGAPGDGDGPPPPPRTPDDPPPPGPGNRSLGTIPEARVTRGDDGLISHVDGKPVDQYLREVMDQRTEAFRARDGFSRGEVGEVTSVVVDRRTGEVFEGTNGRPSDVIPDDELHPVLRERLERLEADGPYPVLNRDGTPVLDADGQPVTQPYPHPDQPLGHAEVKAVNELLWRRGADADASVLDEMLVDNRFPFGGDAPRPAPCCANCHNLLGSPSNVGRFTGWPPGPHNFQPE